MSILAVGVFNLTAVSANRKGNKAFVMCYRFWNKRGLFLSFVPTWRGFWSAFNFMLQSYSHQVVTSTRNISDTRAPSILLLTIFKVIQTIFVFVRLGYVDMPQNEAFILLIIVLSFWLVMTPNFSILQLCIS